MNLIGGEVVVFLSNSFTDMTQRFHQVPTFGQDTIQQFSKNISEMMKLAGYDFEDILQV